MCLNCVILRKINLKLNINYIYFILSLKEDINNPCSCSDPKSADIFDNTEVVFWIIIKWKSSLPSFFKNFYYMLNMSTKNYDSFPYIYWIATNTFYFFFHKRNLIFDFNQVRENRKEDDVLTGSTIFERWQKLIPSTTVV